MRSNRHKNIINRAEYDTGCMDILYSIGNRCSGAGIGCLCLVVLAILLACGPMEAQVSQPDSSGNRSEPGSQMHTGAIAGSVLDPQKGVIVGAQIHATDLSTNRVYTVLSDGQGAYRLALPDALYSLEVSAKGFKKALIPRIEVLDNDVTVQNISLSIGEASNVILVEAIASPLDREYPVINVHTPTTQEILPKNMTTLLLNEAQTGSYKALEMLPSVNDQTGDAYGLALGKTLRLRGAFASDEFLRNIEGLPVSSHGGGGDFIDFENIQRTHVFRGPMPTARSFGVRNMTGGMDLSVLWPQDKFGIFLKQGLGADNFRRTFLRIDSGTLPTGTRLFGSFSTTEADKWRGEGGQPESRINFEMGVTQKLGNRARIDFFAVHHELKQNDFRALTFDQAQDLATYGEYDYNKTLTGVPAQDQYYYGFTRQSYRDTLLLANFEFSFSPKSKLTVKPYYWKDEGFRLIGAANGYRHMATQPQQYGLTAQYDFSFEPVKLSVGYWYQTMEDPLPPPLAQKQYKLNATTPGAALVTFQGWTSLRTVGDRNYNTPYIVAETTLGRTTLTGSLKYTILKDPGQTFLQTTGLPDVSFKQALALHPAVDPDMLLNSRTWKAWEPSVSINHAIRENMIAYFAYGKGYQFNSWNGQSSAYTNNKALFRAAGISFNRLWDSLKPERYDNFDFGFRYKSEMFSVSPVFYYSLDKNKTVTIYDPVVGAPYLQSNTDATSCGAEFEFTFRPPMSGSNSLLFYLSSSYNNFQFDHNTRNASNNIVQSKGKQMADTPKNMTKLGVTYSIYGFSITPMVRYLSSRFADIENKQRVEGYPLADLHASYSPREGIFKDLTLSFSIVNLFDKRYIGLINTSDFSLSNSTSFYPGASRTVMGGISMRIDALVRGIAK